MQETCTIWVCRNCMLHHANGECGSCHTDEGHDREPLCLVDVSNITMGMLGSEHAEDCQRRKFADNLFASAYLPDSDYECNCEIETFSWSSCEGCGNTFGDERHAMTLWFWVEDPLDKARAMLEPYEPIGDDYRD